MLPPNISWADVLEEKLTPSEDTTGKWVASTTSFDRKGLRLGMESSPASAEVKGSTQAEERETEKKKSGEEEGGVRVRQQWEKTSMQNTSPRSGKHRWLEAVLCYLPTLLPRGARSSRTAWRPGKSTAGRRSHSVSSLHCRGERDEFGRWKTSPPINKQT